MSLVFACIAPHGDLGRDPGAAHGHGGARAPLRRGRVETAIVVTPHNVHVERHFAVVTAAHVGEWEVDRETAAALLAADLPILGVSYGGNTIEQAEMPLDWGTEVPLDFLRARRIVVVAPARDLPLEEHLRSGRGDRRAARDASR